MKRTLSSAAVTLHNSSLAVKEEHSEKTLRPVQSSFQPFEVDITVRKQILDRPQESESRGPFPAQKSFFPAFHQAEGEQRISDRDRGQSPQRQQLRLRRRGKKQVSKPRAGDGRDADQNDHHEARIHA